MRARYVVGADGMNSTVRERAGIGFTGGTYGESFVLADVRLTGGVPSDEVILYFSPAGMVVVAPLPDGVHRIVATVDDAPETARRRLCAGAARRPWSESRARRGSRGRVGFAFSGSPSSGRCLSPGPSAACRRCRTCAQPGWRAGHECRHPRRRDLGRCVEASPGRQRLGARCLRRRAPPDCPADRGARRPPHPNGGGPPGVARVAQCAAVVAVALAGAAAATRVAVVGARLTVRAKAWPQHAGE